MGIKGGDHDQSQSAVLMGHATWESSRKTSVWAWCNEGIVIGARARGVYEYMSIEGGIVIRARARGCIWAKQNGN